MRLWMLGSGSRGNAVLLECGDSRVLVDAGFPATVIARRLRSIGVEPESVEAVILTHEHSDHVRGAALGARRYGWSLHATAGTAAGWPELAGVEVRTFTAGASIVLDRIELQTVTTSHDASDPVALVATARCTGARVGIAYDLGYVSEPVRAAFHDLDLLVLEANHDEGMLRAGPYPPVVRQRIASRTGHLSNHAAADMARDCVHEGLREVVLAHLSQVNNDPPLATRAVGAELRRARYRGGLTPAPQGGVIGPFAPAADRVARRLQLDLAL
jgi:phosphoribosyl 1,2-cyclic phosphodiesterase